MNLIEGHRPITPAEGIPVWDVDPYDETILRNPYGYYAHLRELGEVVYIPRYRVLAVGRYATTHKVFSDHEHFVSSRCPLFGLARFGDNDIYAMASAT